jgi:hypothetical protein
MDDLNISQPTNKKNHEPVQKHEYKNMLSETPAYSNNSQDQRLITQSQNVTKAGYINSHAILAICRASDKPKETRSSDTMNTSDI